MKRRSFLKGTLATGATAVAVSAGLLTPSIVLAEWNTKAFAAKSVDEAISAVFNSSATETSADIILKAPAIAENGLVTPVTIDATKMSGVESIAILANKNPMSLACHYSFTDLAIGYVATRIKLGESQNVIGVVQAGGKLFKVEQEVKVTIGGCGG